LLNKIKRIIDKLLSMDHLVLGDEHSDNEHDTHANTHHEIISQALDHDDAKDDDIMR
jgi:hypothetical protein